jgi:glutamyl-tRNA(Gln) amidotransferase subunit D
MGQRVELHDPAGVDWTGTIVPRHDFSGDRILQLKLESGYNVGIRIGRGFTFRISGSPSGAGPRPAPTVPSAPTSRSAEHIALLTTGGTIASRVDYETGGVRPVNEEREILEFYPDLASAGAVRVVPVFDRLSEDITPHDWSILAERVALTFREGARGIVIAHGTDTLGFTAAALSFLLPDLPGPVVLVGAQRSPDRPSSDGTSNLQAAARVARDPRIGEVVVVMHAGLSDTRYAIHRGTHVRKMHSSRRDAFQTRNGPPLGYVEGSEVHLGPDVRPPSATPVHIDGPIDPLGRLLWFYPGLSAEQAETFILGARGVVLAGTGLGHVASIHLAWIRRAVASGVVVAMTTQCLEGNADPFVYATGRDLLRAGVLFLDDLLPETAYVKLLWALGHAPAPEGVKSLLRTDRVGEFQARHLARGDA